MLRCSAACVHEYTALPLALIRLALKLYAPVQLDEQVHKLVGLVGLEPTTPALSTQCSNQLSYRP